MSQIKNNSQFSDEDQLMRERHQHESQSDLDEQEEPSPIIVNHNYINFLYRKHQQTMKQIKEEICLSQSIQLNPHQKKRRFHQVHSILIFYNVIGFEDAKDRVLQNSQLQKSVEDNTKFLGFSTIQHMNKWIQNQSIEMKQTLSPSTFQQTIKQINIKLSINFKLNLIQSQICFKNTIVDILRFKQEKQFFKFLEISGAYEATIFFLEKILKEVENEKTNHYNCHQNGKQRNDQNYCDQMMKNYTQATSDAKFIYSCIDKLQLLLMSL
ncbi:hypothetical protein OXYTRIMIC_146 [Oxytricha trifallax]|uniref:Uncharacterized protein n=1 Tax=Oxytricha trifallax TaxID=1172189 RepID=A0A073I0N8_9SPIT|nr:hypothetical protein OXYTRIMIC_146 [Oxytricha trifallax]